ncbi:hypothetical protein ABZT26_02955 [Streptomyces sp. NPDC005395]|uniref:hypothetical protein n=1 Tax=Streptomyces sp. NPDC005395 TaxID=3157042 RepID=UPI0033B0A23D
MDSLIGPLGPVGLAVVLTAVLIFGTKEGKEGKAKPLGWWAVLFLSLLAGAAFTAGGWPFNVVPNIVTNDLLGTLGAVMPGLAMPAIALTIMAILAWVGLTRRQVAVTGLILFYVLSGSGGGLGTVPERINAVARHFAS